MSLIDPHRLVDVTSLQVVKKMLKMSKVLFASFLFHSPKIMMLSDHVQCTVEVLESSQLLYVLRRKFPRTCVKNVAIISKALVSLRWIHLYILHHAKDNGDPSESKCKWFQVLPNAPVKSYAPASDSVLIVSYPVFSLQPGICTLKPNAWGKDLWIVNVLELHIDQLAHAGKAFNDLWIASYFCVDILFDKS